MMKVTMLFVKPKPLEYQELVSKIKTAGILSGWGIVTLLALTFMLLN